MPTKERTKKTKQVLSLRQPDLRVALEEVTNTHNASAVVRTCDAAGIMYVEIISASGEPFPVNRAISTRAEKWLKFNYYSSTSECLKHLKDEGFTIVATHLSEEAAPYTSLDYTEPTVIVFGNESEGISEEAIKLSDHIIQIPMVGMVQSLNLSVSVGIILYEAMKQRQNKGYYANSRLSSDEFQSFLNQWLKIPPHD
ncbi:MAG TPA: RNA methyltransferase [Candidatus Heimdallarchaeota archaeon]|nr:RNA methyltransferase [Candidatus Heimdallarchaeota archaeon]